MKLFSHCVRNVHNSSVERGGEGRGYGVGQIFSLIPTFSHIQQGFQVIIGLKLNIRNISIVTTYVNNTLIKKGFLKTCL